MQCCNKKIHYQGATMTPDDLAAQLARGIRTSKYPRNSQLPSEENLAKEHGVSVRLVREALAQLVGKGLIKKSRGVRATVK